MSDFFRSFNKIVGQRQRATMAYRPQANGTTERMVGTLTRAVKMISISEIETNTQSASPSRSTLPKIASEEIPRSICYTAGIHDLR
ncbi:Reverse transcriptase [Phytophthora palmivora]|uniref:Reverse transcriptase n=1 Tax=Phytophthora palmivora TaxID=4796 RepID=A0A2P4XYJ6_9STRA|nr:Reverse transcriptase [Phytophthora palmivora]